MKNMRIVFLMVLLPALAALPLDEPRVPRNADEVARPGGKLPGNVRIALVKVAENFYDPTNVASANDGSGRIFVVERVGRVKIVHKDGRVQKEPFLDLTNINPLGTDVQTGFVEQGLYSIAFHPRFKENGYFYVHYASLPFNGDGVIVRFQVDPKSANVMTPERTRQTAKVLLRIEQPYYNHNGGQIEFGPDGYLYIADVGQNHWEEIDFQPSTGKGGENYGWSKMNGTKCFPMTGPDDKCPQVGVLPAAEYPHEIPYPGAAPLKDGWGCSVQGLGV